MDYLLSLLLPYMWGEKEVQFEVTMMLPMGLDVPRWIQIVFWDKDVNFSVSSWQFSVFSLTPLYNGRYSPLNFLLD